MVENLNSILSRRQDQSMPNADCMEIAYFAFLK